MGRRYYCDYCDKTFIDELEARKKHLKSSNHIKMRNIYYERARDPATILKEELLKIPCRRLAQSGACPFEGYCKYSHYSPEQLCELRQHVEAIEAVKRQKVQMPPEIPTVETWLEKYEQAEDIKSTKNLPWTYPESLENRTDLPPSLLKFKPEHFSDDNFEEWGV